MDLNKRNERQKAFFAEKIDTYDDTHSVFMDTKSTLADSLDKDAKKILDLGAGTGLELIHLFEVFPGAQVTAIDITQEMLDALKKRPFGDKVVTICGDFFNVDFGSGYDAVISTSALHHFKEDEKLVLYRRILDCLKDGGQFINCDKIALSDEAEAGQLDALENHFDDYKHLDTPLTPDHEVEVVKSVGFSDVTSSEVDREDYRLIKARKRSK